MRILHVSDTHGRFPELELDGVDLIVHSGDMLPNITWGIRETEVPYQNEWVREKADVFAMWFRGKPVLFTPGNHDFVDPCTELFKAGVNIVNILDRKQWFEGVSFYGFPWVPRYGSWNYGVELDEMELRLRDAIEAEPDVFVPHCPPWGVLDAVPRETLSDNVDLIGSRPLRDWLESPVNKKPRVILCGHCHEARGTQVVGETFVSNAATTQRVVEV